ncbi:hypothetical protein SLS53_001798 [Cytospora paraplurivora]|uniref:Uncharacterized protein n=1 Tax=Cytospora paraplurivora TaxID=2898453 RepID=A0AAN9YJP1_9PEZI
MAVKSEPHTDELSPVSSVFGHDALQQTYCHLGVHEDNSIKVLVHRFNRQEDGSGVTQEQTLLGSQFTLPSQNPPSYTELELVIITIHVPFQLRQLEMLLHCLHKGPDVHRPLATTGYTPFSYMAELLFEHLSSCNHAAGNDGDDKLLTVLCQCFQIFLRQGADPNTLVGGRPLLFRLLEAPVATRAYGSFWDCVLVLARVAIPVSDHHQHDHCGANNHGPNALHALLEGISGGGSSITRGTVSAPTPTSAVSMETQNRVQLTILLIRRLAELGRLDDRGPRGLSAFQLYVRDFTGRDSQHSNYEHHFFRVGAEFIRHGADTDGVLPRGFAEDVGAAFRTGTFGLPGRQQQQQQQQQQGSSTTTTNTSTIVAATPLWVAIWISACQLALSGDEVGVDEHLSVLQYCIKGQIHAEALRMLLPEPATAAILASPETTGSEGSSDEGNYTW